MSESDDLEEVRRRLEEIQQTKRSRMRWEVSRRTAEMALVALDEPGKATPSKTGKARRRKRHKRLL